MNKKLFIFPFLSAVALLVISCSDVSKQKKWIYADIETKIWQEKTYNAVNAAYESLKENASDYVDNQVQVCRSNWSSSDARDFDIEYGNSLNVHGQPINLNKRYLS